MLVVSLMVLHWFPQEKNIYTLFSINKKNKQKAHLQLVKLPSRQILFEYPKIHLAVRLKAFDLISHRPAKMERSKSSKRVVL